MLDKICKYEMVPTSIVEDTEQTLFCPQTDGQMDGRTDGWTDDVKPLYPLFNFVEGGGGGGGGGGIKRKQNQQKCVNNSIT